MNKTEIKLKKYSLPELTKITIHIVNTKEGFLANIICKNITINSFSTKELIINDDNLADGMNIECEIKGNKLVAIENEDSLLKGDIYDFSETQTIFGPEVFVDMIFNESEMVITILFQDLLICKVRVSEESKSLFKRRNTFKCILHNDGILNIVRYTPLHDHTTYSVNDSINKVEALAQKTEYCSAITDHGNMYATLKWNKEMKKLGKKPIFGFEGYIEELDDDIKFYTHQDLETEEEIIEYKRAHCKGRHVLFLAKDKTGFSNLIKLTTEGQLFFYNRPHIRFDVLEKYHEGIICSSACFGGILPKAILKNDNEKVRKYIELMIKWFTTEDFYIEIQRHATKELMESLIKEKNIPLTFEDLNKLNIQYFIKNILDKEMIKDFYKDKNILEEQDIISFITGNMKKYKDSVKSYSINSYIDFICHLSKAFYIRKEKIIKAFDFKCKEEAKVFEIDKKIISDVLFCIEEIFVNNKLISFAKEYGLKTIATSDTHYTDKEDSYLHEIWLCQQTKDMTIDSPKHRQFPGYNYHIHNSKEMVELYKDIPETLDNTLEIADKCNVSLDVNEYFLPDFPLPEGFETQIEYFKHLCSKGFSERFKGTDKYKSQEYLDRMKFEISTVERMGFPSYFLIVQDFIKWAQDKNVKDHIETYFPKSKYDWDELPDFVKNKDYEIYIGPGRGSAAGSLVAYCLGITQIDPIEYDLLFERFLNPSRISMPDIDIDIDDERRNDVFNYTRVKYGYDHTSRIITFGTAKPKASVGVVQRKSGLNLQLKDKICNTIPNKPNTSFKSTMAESVEFAELYQTDKEARKCIDLAKKFENLITNIGQHACGFLITPKPVVEYVPQVILKDKDGIPQLTTQWDKDECEAMGVLKMDFLGLKTLSLIRNSLYYVNLLLTKNGQKPINSMYEIPLFDKKVYEFISKGDTSGVFQIESSGMKGLMVKLYKDIYTNKNFTGRIGFNRLSDAIALYRPGPMDEIDNYLNNMMHPENIVYETPLLKKRLESTYGVIVYQEQAMLLCRDLAGFSEGQADKVRKGMAKKISSILTEYREYFIYGSKDKEINGCINNGIDETIAIKIWDKMEKFGSYAFNKSHSIAYAYLVAYTAWLACYYPAVYMSTVLTSNRSDKDKLRDYLNDAKAKGIELLQPDINKSVGAFSPVDDNSIRIGLRGIKKLDKFVEHLLKERDLNGEYHNIVELVERMFIAGKPIGKSQLEALIYSGTLDNFGGTRQLKLKMIDTLLSKFDLLKQSVKNNQVTIFDIIDINPRCLSSASSIKEYYFNLKMKDIQNIEDDGEMNKQLMLSMEKEYAGIYITEHPLEEYQEILNNEKFNNIQECLPEVIEDEDGNDSMIFSPMALSKKDIKLAGIVLSENTFYTKDNKPLSIFRIEDITGAIDCVAFSETRKNCIELLETNSIISIEGTLNIRNDVTQVVVKSVVPISYVGKKSGIAEIILTASNNEEVMDEQYYKLVKEILPKHLAKENEIGTKIIFKVPNVKEIAYPQKVHWNDTLRAELSQIFTNLQQG